MLMYKCFTAVLAVIVISSAAQGQSSLGKQMTEPANLTDIGKVLKKQQTEIKVISDSVRDTNDKLADYGKVLKKQSEVDKTLSTALMDVKKEIQKMLEGSSSKEVTEKLHELRKKLDQVEQDFQPLSARLGKLEQEVNGNKDNLGNLEKKITEQIEQKLAILQKASAIQESANQFLTNTSIVVRRNNIRGENRLTMILSANDIPLGMRELTLSTRFMNGPKKLVTTVSTDADGVAKYNLGTDKNWQAPTYLIVEFAGDSKFRRSEKIIQIK